jgi:hypothetical protein
MIYAVINCDNVKFSYHYKVEKAQEKALKLKEKFGKREEFYVLHIPSLTIVWNTKGKVRS